MREIIVGTIGFCIMAGSVFLLFRSVISVVIAPGEDVAEWFIGVGCCGAARRW